jgi:hypothetical protein
MILFALVCSNRFRQLTLLDRVRLFGTVFAASKSTSTNVARASSPACSGLSFTSRHYEPEIVELSRCIASTRSTISPACPR